MNSKMITRRRLHYLLRLNLKPLASFLIEPWVLYSVTNLLPGGLLLLSLSFGLELQMQQFIAFFGELRLAALCVPISGCAISSYGFVIDILYLKLVIRRDLCKGKPVLLPRRYFDFYWLQRLTGIVGVMSLWLMSWNVPNSRCAATIWPHARCCVSNNQ